MSRKGGKVYAKEESQQRKESFVQTLNVNKMESFVQRKNANKGRKDLCKRRKVNKGREPFANVECQQRKGAFCKGRRANAI